MKKIRIFVFIGVLAIAGVCFLIIFLNRRTKPVAKPQAAKTISPTATPAPALSIYKDDAGYQFSYPASMAVSQLPLADNNTYSAIELQSGSDSGKITLQIVATSAKSLEDWYKSEQIKPDKYIKKIQMGDLEAQQFAHSGELTTIALDQGTLLSIKTEGYKNDPTLEAPYQKLIATFTFVAPETKKQTVDKSANTAPADTNDSFAEGEEEVQ